ncbi:MAG: 4-hydroxy-3-methylbut-2-enyl diphosphate reductase [Nitrospirae bacterium]|nr:4-hydroxy-3-methylbut-2-enyl diphosphate reductase [Nitrospirota bacterium]
MQITVAKKAGFCFGVKRAIDIAFKLARDTKKEIYEEITKIGYKIVDATCPFVKKAQKRAQTLKEEGYQILIVGDKEHPEVQALLGFAGDDAIVLCDKDTVPPLKKKVGIIVQTTQPVEALKKIVCHVISEAEEVKVYNTICDSTSQRLEETKDLAKEVDIMMVVGGKNSANTAQLARLSAEICPRVYFIETTDEIKEDWFNGAKKIGITGGASTPRWIIDGVVKKLKEISVKR